MPLKKAGNMAASLGSLDSENDLEEVAAFVRNLVHLKMQSIERFLSLDQLLTMVCRACSVQHGAGIWRAGCLHSAR